MKKKLIILLLILALISLGMIIYLVINGLNLWGLIKAANPFIFLGK